MQNEKQQQYFLPRFRRKQKAKQRSPRNHKHSVRRAARVRVPIRVYRDTVSLVHLPER